MIALLRAARSDRDLRPQQDLLVAEVASGFTIDASRSLTFSLHEVYLALATTPIEGPAYVDANFEFRAAFSPTVMRSVMAVLKNQQAVTGDA